MRRLQGQDGQKLRQLATRVKWYHTIDLGEGLVTKGTFDIRSQVAKYGFPDTSEGNAPSTSAAPAASSASSSSAAGRR